MISVVINNLAVKNPHTSKPSAKRTLTRYLQAVNGVFEFAEQCRYTTYNPCKYVKIPKDAPQTKREAISDVDYKTILSSSDPLFLAAKMMILLGLRRGEATALTFGDIDLKNKKVKINKSYNFKDFKLKPPKSEAGNREIPIPDLIIPELTALKETHSPKDLIFITDKGKMFTEQDWKNLNKYIVNKSGVEFTWHQLRHTFASICYDADVDVLTFSKWCGHADIKVSLAIYTHLSERKQEVSASQLNSFLAL